jgi:anti-sigma B factor antagonist
MNLPTLQYTEKPNLSLLVTLTEPFLDMTVQEVVKETIEAEWRKDIYSIIFDCTAVEFMDSSGVGLLLTFHKKLGSTSRRIVLKNLRPSIRSVFALLCLEDLFEFV